MALITKIETLRKYVKLSATSTSAVMLPDFDMPEWKYLVPILGNDLYAQLGDNIAAEGWGKLLDMCRAIVAPMAVYHDLAFLQATLTDTGIKVMSSESMQSAPKWVYREVRESLLEKASLSFLKPEMSCPNASKYPSRLTFMNRTRRRMTVLPHPVFVTPSMATRQR